MDNRSKLCQYWSRDEVKWYMLSNIETVGRIGCRKNASPGRIFAAELEGDRRNEDGITLTSCYDDRIRVKWRSGVFYGLDDDEKEILMAEQDLKERLKLFEDFPQLLAYAINLKVGDKVTIKLKVKKNLTHVDGTVGYIGNSNSKTLGRFFGVQVDSPLDPSLDNKFDWCRGGKGVLVSVSNLVPRTLKQGAKRNSEGNFGGHEASKESKTDDDPLGLDAPFPSYVKEKDAVLVKTRTSKNIDKDEWVIGMVVFVKGDKLAVKVDAADGRVITPWRGMIHGKKVFHKYSSQTVLVNREDVAPIDCIPAAMAEPAEMQYTQDVVSKPFHQNQLSQKGKGEYTENMKKIPGRAVKKTTETDPSPGSNQSKKEQGKDDSAENMKNIPHHATKETTVTDPSPGSYQSKKEQGTKPMRNTNVKSSKEDSLRRFGSSPMKPNYTGSHERVSSASEVSSGMQNVLENNRTSDDEGGERFSSCQSDLNLITYGEQSSLSEDRKKSLTSKVATFFSRAEPPSYPFTGYEVDAISRDEFLCKNLIAGFKLEKKWKSVLEKEKEKFFRMEKLLRHWWKEIHEGHKDQLHHFKTILSQSGRDDIRDHIDKAPGRGVFDETVLNTVMVSVGRNWRKFVSELGVNQSELIANLKHDMSDSDSLMIAIQVWYRKEEGCSKLSKLVKACREIGKDTLADEIEQGLSEFLLKKIAHQIELKNWQSFGSELKVPPIRQHAFSEKFLSLQDRVYNMLCYWSMIQPYDTDKEEKLASALQRTNLGHVADSVLYKGLQQHELETIAALLNDNWQKLAAVHLNTPDINYIMGLPGDSSQRAFKCLKLLKRRQSSDTEDLKEALYSVLISVKLNREARHLYNGLDHLTLVDLSGKLVFDWPLLASYFQYKKEEIADRLKERDQFDMCLKVLREWLHANMHEDQAETKQKLLEGLVSIGREDLVEWLQNREDGEPEEGNKNKMLQRASASKSKLESKKLTRINMGKVARKFRKDQAALMDLLSLNHDDLHVVSGRVKENVMLSLLVAWKKKERCKDVGEAELYDRLMDLLKLYGEEEAYAVLSDGSSVDPPSYGNALRGAVGGSSVHEEPAYHDVNLDSMVEVTYGGQTLTGVIRWIGDIKGIDEHGKLAGVELDEFLDVGGTDGRFNGRKLFHCQYGKGLVLPLTRCKPDSRFLTETETFTKKDKLTKEDFGGMDCDPIEGYIDPPNIVHHSHVGLFKGIQGDHNSCYMDVTLFSMFAYNSVFDAILFHDDSTKEDIRLIKDALRKTIVNPLRSIGYVRADYVLAFRDLLSGLSSMQGLRTEEKDPEEFIHALLQELLSAKPFLNISQGKNATMESYVYQIFLDKTDNADTSTVSDLLHMSFRQSDLKLSEVPECLIIQLPRYGKKYKLYDWIIPSLEMDISLLIHENPRPCVVCGNLAFVECKDCLPQPGDDTIIQSFCGDCFKEGHSSKDHQSVALTVPQEAVKEFQKISKEVHEDDLADRTQHLYPEHRMELFSVVCIETSHYVAFVKTGSGRKEEWVFFDSMADRKGDQHGYNIPEVTHLNDFRKKMESDSLREDVKKPGFSKYLKRLLSDAYICFYRPVKKGKKQNLGVKGDPAITSVSHQPSLRLEEHLHQSRPSRSSRDQDMLQSYHGENYQDGGRHETGGLDHWMSSKHHVAAGKLDYQSGSSSRVYGGNTGINYEFNNQCRNTERRIQSNDSTGNNYYDTPRKSEGGREEMNCQQLRDCRGGNIPNQNKGGTQQTLTCDEEHERYVRSKTAPNYSQNIPMLETQYKGFTVLSYPPNSSARKRHRDDQCTTESENFADADFQQSKTDVNVDSLEFLPSQMYNKGPQFQNQSEPAFSPSKGSLLRPRDLTSSTPGVYGEHHGQLSSMNYSESSKPQKQDVSCNSIVSDRGDLKSIHHPRDTSITP